MASMGMPAPTIIMPVCPVARKVEFIPALRMDLSNARAVYFLPTAQSVPTVKRRLPKRFIPVPTGRFFGGTRMSINRESD